MGKLIVGAVIVIAAISFFVMRGNKAAAPATPTQKSQTANTVKEAAKGPVKEFTMTSYADATGKWFSLKEIDVKKGDTVRIKITNTAGSHNFNIDRFGVYKVTPLNEETVVEFTADATGEFPYYCSMTGHREAGQVGMLKVTE